MIREINAELNARKHAQEDMNTIREMMDEMGIERKKKREEPERALEMFYGAEGNMGKCDHWPTGSICSAGTSCGSIEDMIHYKTEFRFQADPNCKPNFEFSKRARAKTGNKIHLAG